MRVPSMPRWLHRLVEPRLGPIIFLVVIVGVSSLGFTDRIPLDVALGCAIVIALAAMMLREWVFLEGSRRLSEHRRLLLGLERATASSHAAYSEDVEQIWYIEADGNDVGYVEYETRVDAPDSMAWRRVKLFATENIPVPDVERMRFEALECESGDIESFRLKEGSGLVDYVIFFRTPVTATSSRRWAIRYTWPGFWNPLRELGEDHFILEFNRPAQQGSIRIVFPDSAGSPPRQLLRRFPDVGAERYEQYNGRPSLVWTFGPCAPGQTYRADIRAQLPSVTP